MKTVSIYELAKLAAIETACRELHDSFKELPHNMTYDTMISMFKIFGYTYTQKGNLVHIADEKGNSAMAVVPRLSYYDGDTHNIEYDAQALADTYAEIESYAIGLSEFRDFYADISSDLQDDIAYIGFGFYESINKGVLKVRVGTAQAVKAC